MTELSSSALVEDLGPPSKASEERAASLVGRLISERYRVHETLGQGAMGAVYRGEQIHLHKIVAIKVLLPDTEKLPDLVARFEREAVAGAHVQHPNVAGASDFGKLDDGSYFLVLEYVEGARLKDLLKEGPVPAPRALRIARQIAAGLDAVHEKGIIHRDIKPQNVLLGPNDQVKIIDFGLAKVRLDLLPEASRKESAKQRPLTTAGMIFGTPAYIAPEAALGMSAVDARGDLYALGVTLYEMLAGRHPFEWTDMTALLQRQRTEDPPPICVRSPEVSVPLEAERVAMRLVQRNPSHRFQTAREVMAAIDEALQAIGEGASSISVDRGQSGARLEPRALTARGAGAPRWVLGVVVAGAMVVVSIVVLALRGRSTSPSSPAAAANTTTSGPTASVDVPASSATATALLAEIDGADAAQWRARFHKGTAIKAWALAAKAFLALMQLDPHAIDDATVRADVVLMAAGIAFEGKTELSDAVFESLTSKLGTGGLDLLFELVRSRGGTRGGQRAREILSQPDVRERATPALRITFDLHGTRCASWPELFERAGADGDRRTLGQLQVAHGTRCKNPKDPCCFHENRAIVEAIQKIKARLGD